MTQFIMTGMIIILFSVLASGSELAAIFLPIVAAVGAGLMMIQGVLFLNHQKSVHRQELAQGNAAPRNLPRNLAANAAQEAPLNQPAEPEQMDARAAAGLFQTLFIYMAQFLGALYWLFGAIVNRALPIGGAPAAPLEGPRNRREGDGPIIELEEDDPLNLPRILPLPGRRVRINPPVRPQREEGKHDGPSPRNAEHPSSALGRREAIWPRSPRAEQEPVHRAAAGFNEQGPNAQQGERLAADRADGLRIVGEDEVDVQIQEPIGAQEVAPACPAIAPIPPVPAVAQIGEDVIHIHIHIPAEALSHRRRGRV